MNKFYVFFVIIITLSTLALAVVFPYFGIPVILLIGLLWEPILSATVFKGVFEKEEGQQ